MSKDIILSVNLNVDQLKAVADALQGVLKLEGGEIVTLATDETTDQSMLEELYDYLVEAVGDKIHLVQLRPGDELGVLPEEELARLAHARGYYKAEPDR